MASIIKFDKSSHWYLQNGDPQHDATLREARKQRLYPSVTSIDKDSFPNAFLDMWKTEQLIGACVGNSRMPHESVAQYAQRIYDLSNTKSHVAAEFGKKLHAAVDKYPLPFPPELSGWQAGFGKWYDENIKENIASEKVMLDHDIGVAGTCDRIAHHITLGRCILDYKTQGIKEDEKGRKKPNFYDSWVRQLACYAVADAKENGMFPILPRCINVVIDSDPRIAGHGQLEIYYKVWSEEEIVAAYEEFVAGVWLWCRKRNYFPVGKWNLHDINDKKIMPVLRS